MDIDTGMPERSSGEKDEELKLELLVSNLDRLTAHWKKTEGALADVKGQLVFPCEAKTNGAPRVVLLPSVPLHGLETDRFGRANRTELVPVVLRPSMHVLWEKVQEPGESLYVHGPRGCGKSHALLATVCKIRSEGKARVVYIQDTKAWTLSLNPLDYLVKEILATYGDVVRKRDLSHPTEPGKKGSFITWTIYLLERNIDAVQKKERFNAFLEALAAFALKDKKPVFFVVDQHNFISRYVAEKRQSGTVFSAPFPFNLPSVVKGLGLETLHCVVSASANNEAVDDPATFSGWSHLELPHGEARLAFTRQEALAYVKDHAKLPVPEDKMGELLDLLERYTELIPLEVSLALDQLKTFHGSWSTGEMKNCMDEYFRHVVSFYARRHDDFYERQRQRNQKALRQSIVRMIMRLPSSPADIHNRQLMYLSTTSNPPRYFRWLHPAAHDVLLTSVQEEEELLRISHELFEGITAGARGLVVEYWFIGYLKWKALHPKSDDHTFHFRRLSKLENAEATRLTIKLWRPVIGNLGPMDTDVKEARGAEGMLFVPQNPNYPAVDFFIYQKTGTTEKLYCCQVTLQSPHKHGNTFFTHDVQVAKNDDVDDDKEKEEEVPSSKRRAVERTLANVWYQAFHKDSANPPSMKDFLQFVWIVPRGGLSDRDRDRKQLLGDMFVYMDPDNCPLMTAAAQRLLEGQVQEH